MQQLHPSAARTSSATSKFHPACGMVKFQVPLCLLKMPRVRLQTDHIAVWESLEKIQRGKPNIDPEVYDQFCLPASQVHRWVIIIHYEDFVGYAVVIVS